LSALRLPALLQRIYLQVPERLQENLFREIPTFCRIKKLAVVNRRCR
jgi:hypothetical protein